MSERRNEAAEEYLAALRTGKPTYPQAAIAVAGMYRMRYPAKDSPWCAVKIVEICPTDDETGELIGDVTYEATANGQAVAVEVCWPYCGRFPITADAYAKMVEAPAPQTETQAEDEPMQSEAINELAAALAKTQGEVKGAAKDVANPFFKSKYADLASVWDACRDALSKHGLSVVQTTKASDGTVITVVTQLMHASGQWLRGELTMRPVKADPQGVGSAITYARRYALAAMVGVAPEDDDGEGASGRQTKPEPSKARTDERLMAATEWANSTANQLDLCKTVGFVNELMNEPKTVAYMKKLYDAYPDVYQIVERARTRAADRLTKAAA